MELSRWCSSPRCSPPQRAGRCKGPARPLLAAAVQDAWPIPGGRQGPRPEGQPRLVCALGVWLTRLRPACGLPASSSALPRDPPRFLAKAPGSGGGGHLPPEPGPQPSSGGCCAASPFPPGVRFAQRVEAGLPGRREIGLTTVALPLEAVPGQMSNGAPHTHTHDGEVATKPKQRSLHSARSPQLQGACAQEGTARPGAPASPLAWGAQLRPPA